MKPIANLDEVEFTDIEANGYCISKRAQFSAVNQAGLSFHHCFSGDVPLTFVLNAWTAWVHPWPSFLLGNFDTTRQA